MDLGCTWMQAFWKVIIPEIKPGIVSGALTAFTMSIDDFVISYFTAGSSASTLAMTIYGMTKKTRQPGDQRHLHPAVRHGAAPAGRSSTSGRPGRSAGGQRSSRRHNRFHGLQP